VFDTLEVQSSASRWRRRPCRRLGYGRVGEADEFLRAVTFA